MGQIFALGNVSDNNETTMEFNPTLVRSAFVCPGTCGACLDRAFTCGNSSCSHFMRELEQHTQGITFTCLTCQETYAQPRVCCSNQQPCVAYCNGKQVFNATQLPARVKAVDCGEHLKLHAKHELPALAQAPSNDTQWANRHVVFSNVLLNGQQRRNNHLVCFPKQTLTLSCHYTCNWRYQEGDYCPGCVVQWYLGVETRAEDAPIKIDLIRSYHNGLRGRLDNFSFVAPSSPGIYYLQANISLDYHFLQHIQFTNVPENSMAVIQVAYFDEWRRENHMLLENKVDKLAIATMSLYGQHDLCRAKCMTSAAEDCPCRVFSNMDLQSKVFSFLGQYRN